MPFYKVPAGDGGAGGPRRIRAPLRHSVNNGGGSGATAPRDCDVIDGDCTTLARKTETRANQVILNVVFTNYLPHPYSLCVACGLSLPM